MNTFLLNYENRLQNWYTLRQKLNDSNIKTKCYETDNFWQKTPLVNHYLHIDYVNDWPDPWELLADNNYCLYARGLGIIYTLLLLGIKDIDFVTALDDNNEDVVLVLVDNAKYILNYWPDTVVNNCLQDFSVNKHIDITPIKTKIGIT